MSTTNQPVRIAIAAWYRKSKDRVRSTAEAPRRSEAHLRNVRDVEARKLKTMLGGK